MTEPYPLLDASSALTFAVVVGPAGLRRWHRDCIDRLTGQGNVCAGVVRYAPRGRAGGGRLRWLRAEMLAPAEIDGAAIASIDTQTADRVRAAADDWDVDLLLDVSGTELPSVPASGRDVWWFRFSSGTDGPGTHQVRRGEPTADVSLLRRDTNGDTHLLARGTYAAVQTSPRATADRLLSGAVELLAKGCRLARRKLYPSTAVGADCDGTAWSTGHTLHLLARVCYRRVRTRVVDWFTESQWGIGVVHAPIGDLLDRGLDPASVVWHATVARGVYLADPFALGADPLVVLAEEYDHVSRIGRIVATSYRRDHGWHGHHPLIIEPHHLSYPSVVRDGETVFCIPESAGQRTTRIYRIDEAGSSSLDELTGRPVGEFLGGHRVGDPCVFRYGERWWLFYTDCRPPRDTNLYAWYSSTPAGPWTPHVLNPVKTDVTSSRPGGTPFTYNGHLFRPAQDDAGTYGRRMVVTKILRLTPVEFEEVVVARLGPFGTGPYPLGPHTLSAAGEYTLVDGKRRVFSGGFRVRRLRRRLR